MAFRRSFFNQKAVIAGLVSYAFLFVFVVIPWLMRSEEGQQIQNQNEQDVGENQEIMADEEEVKMAHNANQDPLPEDTDGCNLHLIVLNTTGKDIGDAMFQFAALYSISETNKLKPYLYDRGCLTYRDVFVKSSNLLCNDLVSFKNKVQVRNEANRTDFDPEVMHQLVKDISESELESAGPECDIFELNGARQSWRYFRLYKAQVTELFIFRRPYQTFSREYLNQEIGGRNAISVGIYIETQLKRFETKVSSIILKFLEDAMLHFETIHSQREIHYIIYQTVSTVNLWTLKNMIYDNNNSTIRNFHYLVRVSKAVAMAVLSSCDHVVFTFGSTGWWAGFLSKGTVVYLKDKQFHADVFNRSINSLDYYPPGWIGL